MRRLFISIIVLTLILFGTYWFIGQENLKREDLLTAETLKTLRGRIYSGPDIESSPFKYFFIDGDGNLYGLDFETEDSNLETIERKIAKFADSNKQVEIKGKIEEGVEDYGNKRVNIKEIKPVIKPIIKPGKNNLTNQVQETATCQKQGGRVELKKICVFPDGKELELEKLIK